MERRTISRFERIVSYGQDFVTSARRHFAAAEVLYESARPGGQPGDRAVAGYLYGLAGELALKQLMRVSGMSELQPGERQGDPFWEHFPTIKTLLRDAARGRLAAKLRGYAENAQLFQYWDTEMRYAPTAHIKPIWVGRWREQSKRLVEEMNAEST